MRPPRGLRRGGCRQPDAADGDRDAAEGCARADYAGFQAQGRSNLAAAHSTGTVGPNLDTLKPDYRHVTAQVTNGGAAMPSFKKTLTPQQIADVAAYVVKSTGGTP
jgi:Cytochrome C oxidase, cbb3-type, subunit III